MEMTSKQATSFHKQERFLCYNGEVLIFHLYEGFADNSPANGSSLHVRRMLFDSQTETFILKSTGFINMDEKYSHLKILSCNSVSDFRTGINLPCILIQNTDYNIFNYDLLLLHSSNKFERCLSFKLSYELKDNFWVINGPLVFWQHIKTFFCVSCQIGKVTSVSVNFSSIKWIGEIEDQGIVLLGLTEHNLFEPGSTQKPSASDDAFCNTEFRVYALESQEILSDRYIIPPVYSSVVTYVHIHKTKIIKNQCRMSLIALTQKNQLILFQNGIPKDVCQLPFLDPCAVQVLDSGKGNLFFIVSFQSNEACAVSEKTFQVVAKWEKLSSVLVDDFTGAGNEQVLLIMEDRLSSDLLMSFKITDFVSYSTDPLDFNEDVSSEDKQKSLVILPLETSCKYIFTFIRGLKQHLLLKDTIITQSWEVLVNRIQGKDNSISSDNKEDFLVPSFDEEKECVHIVNENLPDSYQGLDVVVKKMWYHVLNDSLIVGVKITTLKLSSNDVTLSLLMDRNCGSGSPLFKWENKVISKDSFPEQYLVPCEVEPEEKRTKLTAGSEREESPTCGRPQKGESVYVITAVMSLSPLLPLSKFDCTVLLQISERESDGSAKVHCISCGRVLLSLEDLSHSKYLLTFPQKNSVEHIEDLFSLFAVLHKFCFYVTSSFTVLNFVKTWLLEYMKCEAIKEFPEILMYKKMGNCYEIFLYWKQRTAGEGILTLCCRNKGDLLICLHDLIMALPVHFKHLTLGNEDFLVDHLALALERELVIQVSLSTFASEHIRSTLVQQSEASQEQHSAVSPSLARKDLIHVHRTEVHKERAVMDTNLRVSDTVLIQITSELAELQQKSDLIAKKLALTYL